jgi:hypothetical protein
MPLVAQADVAYLFKLGIGELKLPDDTLRRKETLVQLKEIARCYLRMLSRFGYRSQNFFCTYTSLEVG